MFFAIEGIDGSGKTTQARAYLEFLVQRGKKVALTRQPGGTSLGVHIREILLNSGEDIHPYAEYLLFAADRAQHMGHVSNLLERGFDVISDRFIGSSLVYQGVKGVAHEFIMNVFFEAGGFMPDVTFWMDVKPETAMKRLQVRVDANNKYDQDTVENFRARNEEYRRLAKLYNWQRLDGNKPTAVLLERMHTIMKESRYTTFVKEVYGG